MRTPSPSHLSAILLLAAIGFGGSQVLSPTTLAAGTTADGPRAELRAPTAIEARVVIGMARDELPRDRSQMRVRSSARVVVAIDGQRVGYTPVDLDVAPGVHVVTLVDPPTGATIETRRVVVEAGSAATVSVSPR